MPWSPSGCRDMTDKECADFLYAYMHNTPNTINNRNLYRDTLKYIVGSIMIGSKFRFISKKAKETCSKNQVQPTPTRNYDKLGLRIEHPIPISFITDYLITLPVDNITSEKIFEIVKAVRGVALITKEEDSILNKNLKSKLPNDYSIEMLLGEEPIIPFDIRYQTVGIK